MCGVTHFAPGHWLKLWLSPRIEASAKPRSSTSTVTMCGCVLTPGGSGARLLFGGRTTGSHGGGGGVCGAGQPGSRQPQVVCAVPGFVAIFGRSER